MHISEILQQNEGINDPYIFKAIFMAGGAGSGKSFVVRNVLGQFQGLKVLNNDKFLKYLMDKEGLSLKMPSKEKAKRDVVRTKAKEMADKQEQLWRDGRLGIVLDGTGRDLEKTGAIKAKLDDLGYDTMMLYVNTNLKTAIRRNYERERTVPLSVLKKNWNVIQNNIGQFQGMFKGDFHVFDNSDETQPDSKSKIQSFVKITRNVLEKPASKPQAVQFIKTKK